MENFTSWNQSKNYSINSSSSAGYDYYSYDYYGYDYYGYDNFGQPVFCWFYGGRADILTYIIFGICPPLIPVAIYSLYTQVQKDHVAPIYVINLLISDLLQLCCMIFVLLVDQESIQHLILNFVYHCSVMASVGSMVCIALERYLVITQPLWYRFRRPIKISVVVSVLVWVFSVFVVLFYPFQLGFFFLLPLPLLIFFLIGSIKAVSASHSVSADEKRQIVALLVVVLLMYLILFLPFVFLNIFMLYHRKGNYNLLFNRSCSLLQINPLSDLILYFFTKKWAIDKLLAHLCCCKMMSSQSA